MSSPGEYYKALPPIIKAYGTACFVATAAYELGLYSPLYIALFYSEVFYRFQVWRLFTNFFFLGGFSINFGIRLLMILRYGVQLEKGVFDRRTADFLWMMIFGAFSLLVSEIIYLSFHLTIIYVIFFHWGVLSAIPFFWTPFMAVSLVFMLVYVWSREFPNALVSFYGLVSLKAFYLPWVTLALDVIFGSPIMPDLLGIIAGHLFYFLTVLHPLAGGKNILKTPIHKLVARWRIGPPPITRVNDVQQESSSGVFRGRSYRLNG
ncbi:ER-associated protein degradation protein, variant 2 [Lathyrus oleraceus]|uniref:Derlin n=1 Tax=Pisum sativum TaxID=3888 RepID=A0A9D4ZUP2_PEA|nr:ER-associated protein degradation protein, variant 2 [Pisum sativum]